MVRDGFIEPTVVEAAKPGGLNDVPNTSRHSLMDLSLSGSSMASFILSAQAFMRVRKLR